jgi:trehalose synthase
MRTEPLTRPRRTAQGPVRRVDVARRGVEPYRSLVGDALVSELRELAAPLRGLRVLELSSSATGGGVAELLASMVPLQRDLGIDAQWRVIAGDHEFFDITKRIHNGLQGMEIELSDAEREEYLEHNRRNASALDESWDVVIVHDPQPAAIRSLRPDCGGRWIWRCHVDSSTPHASVWEFLRPFVEQHDRAVFTLQQFIPPDLVLPTSVLIPAIDPLTSKNRLLPDWIAREGVAEFGVDLSRPLMLQVSRFDPWKNPFGVIDAWRRAREEVPGLQLAMVGGMATDDPEGWRLYEALEEIARDEPDLLLLTNQMGVSRHEVNAFQTVADVAVQMSVREGFGLVVSETLWKGTAMVAGSAGGIPLQLEDGVTGFLADDVETVADRAVTLLGGPERARELGVAGARRVRERFLMPRLLRDQLALMHDVVFDGPTSGMVLT